MNTHLLRLVRHFHTGFTMASCEIGMSYEVAVRTLNTLQSNASVLEKLRKARGRLAQHSLPEMIEFAQQAGITLDKLDELSVIHVSGTKGKGSTCAFCESILREKGYKTGFFSSPHLVEVRERIRIDGKPLSRSQFSQYFWQCFSKFDANSSEGNRPAYFRFLTIMAFHVFLQEKVDVAIMEVGIGGTEDCTNIVRIPVVCGITSLDLDHTSTLGNTLAEIATHKAGIIKAGVPVVTVSQPDGCNDVIAEKALAMGSRLFLAPPLGSYRWPVGEKVSLGIPGEMQRLNASLALQLARIWCLRNGKGGSMTDDGISKTDQLAMGEAYHLSTEEAAGIRQCEWLGRSQLIAKTGISYYIDGAHTVRSMQACIHWFMSTTQEEAARLGKPVVKVLIFNCTGGRSAEALLQELVPCGFDSAIFCPNILGTTTEKADLTNFTVAASSLQTTCLHNEVVWRKLVKTAADVVVRNGVANVSNNCSGVVSSGGTHCNGFSTGDVDPTSGDGTASIACANGSNDCTDETMMFNSVDLVGGSRCAEHCTEDGIRKSPMSTFVFANVADSLRWAGQGRDVMLGAGLDAGRVQAVDETAHLQVLCTGSIHLVGGVLALLQGDDAC